MQPPDDPESPPLPALLRLYWAARYLGLSPRSLGDARWRAKHGIPCLHIGRVLVFDRQELDRYLADARHRRGPIGRTPRQWQPPRLSRPAAAARRGTPAGLPSGAEADETVFVDPAEARAEAELAATYRRPTPGERERARIAGEYDQEHGWDYRKAYLKALNDEMAATDAKARPARGGGDS